MRLWLAALLAATLLPAASFASKPSIQEEAMCNAPPCTRNELQRYERRVIKRMQRANALSSEARARGEKDLADRLHRSFQRYWDRRVEIRKAIDHAND
jgi:ribosomal protein S30